MNKEKAALTTIKAIIEKADETLQDDSTVYVEDEDFDLQVLTNALNAISAIVEASV